MQPLKSVRKINVTAKPILISRTRQKPRMRYINMDKAFRDFSFYLYSQTSYYFYTSILEIKIRIAVYTSYEQVQQTNLSTHAVFNKLRLERLEKQLKP